MARGRARALVHLWSERDGKELEQRLALATRGAWETWAAMVADRALFERRAQALCAALRDRVASEEERLQDRKLDALAEFAGGAGHELNNPLAVIAGRAQLLLSRTHDPETARALRIILNQAARAHRILRDLIFVARPPALEARIGRPVELLRACLRDFHDECTARGVRLASEINDPAAQARIDPDAARHLAEILLRNALEATPSGGKILVQSTVNGDELCWRFADSGKGIAPAEATHLFDPFYCGRQAGRGLGLGLPRAARIVQQAGGRLYCKSTPGHGTVFHVHLPLALAAARDESPARESLTTGPDRPRSPET
jgi:signal transduction histidine kinase